MSVLDFATGNAEKFAIARDACMEADIGLHQLQLAIDEIQGEDMTAIAVDKAKRAYAIHQQPLIISDDSWAIPGLGGFPGAYMKSINHWFGVQDLLNLTRDLEDRRICLTQTIVYIDATQTKVFSADNWGVLLKEGRGVAGKATHKLVALNGDNGKTIGEMLDSGSNHTTRGAADIWHTFARWFKSDINSGKVRGKVL